jgi:tetratricopeptide (TPR) repeat protein
MWLFNFPFFALRLTGALTFTVLQLAVFHLSFKKYLFINLFLTMLVVSLAFLLWRLPNSPAPAAPALGLNIRATADLMPIPQIIEAAKIDETLQVYQQAVTAEAFVPQADYVNLAVLAQAAGKYDLAQEYLKMARTIDPNQEFFTEN